MKSVPKFISRSIGLLVLSILLLLTANAILAIVIFHQQFSGEASYSSSPYKYTQKIANHFTTTNNHYELDEFYLEKIEADHVWGIIVDEKSQKVVWQTDNLPENIPQTYSLADISDLTLGYIKGYPTYAGEVDQDLLILGFPKTSYWKMMTPSWSYRFIVNVPQILLVVLTVNIIVILFIYLWFSGRMVRSVVPLVEGIKNLPTGLHEKVREKGPLSEVAENINQTSKVLEEQEKQLSKKEAARADWIAGISHDIRTPLSMVVGYASQLADSLSLSKQEREKSKIIFTQSQKIKQLVNDLNLSSKLEYSMQPIHLEKVNLLSLVRQVIVEFINNNLDEKYNIKWFFDDFLDSCLIQADAELFKRAITNLIQNAIEHNPNGCTIYVSIKAKRNDILVIVEDNGVGVSDLQLKQLNNSSQGLLSKNTKLEQSHGLGLRIVRQIIEAHNGKIFLEKSKQGGFSVTIVIPQAPIN
ncbi:sensor histidine kinase [Tetragenococcus solitarius]|uniref:histidine kinase n=1 Tax=Tetragenococcus solitarius TaxID=71453 RepID=A0ABN3YCU2_9ENTE|nr:HAMP domain-containing sensor histidine kinase [Tetragenococcus solitarius]